MSRNGRFQVPLSGTGNLPQSLFCAANARPYSDGVALYMSVVIPVLRQLGILDVVLENAFLSVTWRGMDGNEPAHLPLSSYAWRIRRSSFWTVEDECLDP